MPERLVGGKRLSFPQIAPMAARILDFDWSTSPAGPVASWCEDVIAVVRTALRSATAMAVIIGREGILIPNDAATTLFGPDYEAVLGRRIVDVFPEGTELIRRIIDDCFAGRSLSFPDEPIDFTLNGEMTTGWFSLSFTPVRNADEQVEAIFLVISDATDRMRDLRALHRARQRTDLALEAGGIVATWDFDSTRNSITLDGSFASLFGLPKSDARKGISLSKIAEFLHSDDKAFTLSQLRSAATDERDFVQRFRAILPGGQILWLNALGRSVRDGPEDGVQLAGVLVDVSKEMEAAAALEQSNLRFDILAEAVPQIVWSTDAGGCHDYFNHRWTEFTGIDRHEIDPETWTSLVHPEDWPRVEAHWTDCLKTGEPYDIDYRFRRRDGTYRWLKVVASPLRGPDGAVLRWYGTAADIDREKMLEAQRALVAQELEHRIKNLFALANALVTLSVRDNPALRIAANDLSARFRALHEAHALVFAGLGEETTSFLALLRRLLAPYIGRRSEKIKVSGDDTPIGPRATTSMALVLHELITNAAKYGALANEGTLQIATEIIGTDLVVVWDEASPGFSGNVEGEGFGSRLIGSTINLQLKGAFSRNATADGTRIRLEIPLSALGSSHQSTTL